MAKNKDPAVLFYPEAYLVGTMFMTYEQKGKYMDLLCFQHQNGHLTEEEMLSVCGTRDERIFSKFEVDEQGKYFNRRMEEEKERRMKYTAALRANGEKGGRPKNTTKPIDNQQGNQLDNQQGNQLRNRNININEYIKSIIEYLNSKLGTKYKYTSDYIQTKIKARLNEGFTPEDFYIVIDKKIHEWRGTKLEKFLRPETLFGTKFQEYLNQIGKRDDEYTAPSQPSAPRHGDFDHNEAFIRALKRSEGG